MPTTFKGICDNYGWPLLHFARKGAVLPYYLFWYNQKGNQEKRSGGRVVKSLAPAVPRRREEWGKMTRPSVRA